MRASLAPRTKSRPSIGCANGDSSAGPEMACSISATSSAVRAIGPVTCSVSHTQSVGCVGTNPTDGRNPVTPQNAAGIRSEPPRSVPSARAIMPVARAAAPPPVEPPADFVGIPRISRASKHLVERVGAGRKLRAVRLAENHGTRCAQPADDKRIFLGYVVCVNRRPERRPQTRDWRDVLDADRQSAQRSRIVSFLDPAIELHGVIERLRIQRDDGVQRRVELPDALEARLHRFRDGHFPRGDSPAATLLRKGRQDSRRPISHERDGAAERRFAAFEFPREAPENQPLVLQLRQRRYRRRDSRCACSLSGTGRCASAGTPSPGNSLSTASFPPNFSSACLRTRSQ